MCSLLLQQNDPCSYIEDCRNSNNETKCSRCENNPFNFSTMEKYGEGEVHYHRGKGYYPFRDNYEPV